MVIEFRNTNEVKYRDLRHGDVFMYCNTVYMYTNKQGTNELIVNLSVNLADGRMEEFPANITIKRISKATCILEN